MNRPAVSNKGLTLIEVLVACAIAALLFGAIFKIFIHVTRGSDEQKRKVTAQLVIDEMLNSAKKHFERRFWAFQSPIQGISLLGLGTPRPFGINPGGTQGLRCSDGTLPSCQDWRLVQTATVAPTGDTYQMVDFRTTCQAGPAFPPEFTASLYHPDGGACLTPPVVTMTTSIFPGGPIQTTKRFLGENLLGTALCARACTIAPAAGPKNPAVVDYHLEAAVIYLGTRGEWKVLKGNSTLSTGDAVEGTQILPQY